MSLMEYGGSQFHIPTSRLYVSRLLWIYNLTEMLTAIVRKTDSRAQKICYLGNLLSISVVLY